MFKFKVHQKKYYFLLILFCLVSLTYILNAKASNSKTVIITFKTNPSYVNITKAPLKYNKDFVFSINADDGIKDSYSIFYKALNGGRIANSDIISKGAYFTDGAGNKIPFRGNFQMTTMNSNITDSFVPIRNIGNIAYVDWNEAKEVSDRGWDITNHGWSHNGFPIPIDRIFPYPAPHNPSTIDYDYEIEQNQLAIEANILQRPIIMGPPDADPGYDSFVYNNHGIYAKIKKFSAINRYTIPGTNITPTLDLNQFNIMGYVYIAAEDNATDIINFVDYIKNSSVGGAHYWNRLTMHRFYEAEGQNGLGYQSLKQIIEHIENNYGYKGADNAWVASSQEVYEYLYAKQNLSINQNLSNNTLTVTLDFGLFPDAFKRMAISLLIDSDAEILSVTSQDVGANISFNSQTGLINTDWKFFNNNAFESDCTAKVVKAETSRNQTDYNEADDYISAMDNGAIKTNLRTRLNNVEIFAREWFVSFGLSINAPGNIFPVSGVNKIWNGVNGQPISSKLLLEASGVTSTLTYASVDQFPFGGFTSSGATTTPDGLGIYLNAITNKTAYSTPSTNPAVIKISGLNADKFYDVEIFSSKTSAITSTYFVIGSATSTTQSLNGYNNTTNTVTFSKIAPSPTNDIKINIAMSGRLGVLHITERPKIEIPVASYPSGAYNTAQIVSLNSLQSDYIKYSYSEIPISCADGILYTSPINIASSTTLYVKACDNSGNFASDSFTYNIDSVPPATATARPSAGSYNTNQLVSLSAVDSDYIKYSFNETPSTCSDGALYTVPITITSSQTIYTRACDIANNSNTASHSFIINYISEDRPVYNSAPVNAPSGLGNGITDVSIPMNTIVNISQINNSGVNVLAYINSQANFSAPESSSNWQQADHNFKITDLDLASNIITIIISSKPQSVSLKKGESREVDLDGDTIKDITLTFVNTYVNRAEITIKSLPKTPTKTEIVPSGQTVILKPLKYIFKNDLKFGLIKSDVKELQKILNLIGFSVSKIGPGSIGKETTTFGPATKLALIKFQKTYKINPAIGYFGAISRKIINSK